MICFHSFSILLADYGMSTYFADEDIPTDFKKPYHVKMSPNIID